MTWLQAFVVTQAVEVLVYGRLLRPTPLLGRVCMAFAVSAATHPWVWFVLPSYLQPSLGYWGYVTVAEGFAVAGEAALLFGFGVPVSRALLAAFVANTASVVAGFFATRALG